MDISTGDATRVESASSHTHASTGVLSWFDHPDLGKLFLRVNVAFLLLFHGLNFAEGDSKGIQMAAVAKLGIPSVVGMALGYVTELVCPILVLLGVYTRAAALGMALFMLSAIFLFWVPMQGLGVFFKMSAQNFQGMFNPYQLETQFFYLWCSLAVVLLGGGKYGLNIGGRWK